MLQRSEGPFWVTRWATLSDLMTALTPMPRGLRLLEEEKFSHYLFWVCFHLIFIFFSCALVPNRWHAGPRDDG